MYILSVSGGGADSDGDGLNRVRENNVSVLRGLGVLSNGLGHVHVEDGSSSELEVLSSERLVGRLSNNPLKGSHGEGRVNSLGPRSASLGRVLDNHSEASNELLVSGGSREVLAVDERNLHAHLESQGTSIGHNVGSSQARNDLGVSKEDVVGLGGLEVLKLLGVISDDKTESNGSEGSKSDDGGGELHNERLV